MNMTFLQLAYYANKYAKLAAMIGIILLATQILISLLSPGWFWFLFLYCIGMYFGLASITYIFVDAGDSKIDSEDRKHILIFGGILCVPYLTGLAGIVYAIFAIKCLFDDDLEDLEIFKDAFMCKYELPEETE